MKAPARTTTAVDTARLGIMLGELRLPTIKTVWPRFAEQADKEGWPAARFLAALAEHELRPSRLPSCKAGGRGVFDLLSELSVLSGRDARTGVDVLGARGRTDLTRLVQERL